MAKWNVTAQDVPGLLELLACSDPDTQQNTLRQLCPCRSRCEDEAIWTEICRIQDDMRATEPVRDQAFHALETLVEDARAREDAKSLLDWLVENRHLVLPLEKPGGPPRNRQGQTYKKEERKITSQDIPYLLETLTCGEEGEQQRALKQLCPCRNARYDKEVWLAIFRAYDAGQTGTVRDQAGHAIGTLLERARIDPRSQQLLRWLAKQGIDSLPLEEGIPVWRPGGRAGLNGLYIPRYERSPRSKTNRRR